MKFLKFLFPYLLIFTLSFFAIGPLMHPGFFPIHDNTQVQRVFEMTKSLKDGMFPVRWVSDLGFGYGYPIFNFYAPFAYYLGSFINILVGDVLLATKLMMAFGIILSGFSMYLFASQLWGKRGGIISALLYVFLPFHAVDIFVRGDVAEFFAYALLPLVFYGLLSVHKTGKFKFIALGSLAFALLITSHNLTAFMSAPFILVFALLLFVGDRKTGIKVVLTLLLGLMLSAFYWLPALTEINSTNVLSQVGGGADYKDHFVCLSQLWSSPWGFGGSVKGCVDGLSFMVGKLHILLSFFPIIILTILLKYKKIESKKLVLIMYFYLSLLFSIFLTQDLSKFIWDSLSPMAIFQYPWRFLLMIGFFISIIAGSSFYFGENLVKNRRVNLIIITILSLLIVGFNSKYFIAQDYFFASTNDFTNNKFLKFNTSLISSEYMPKNFQKPVEVKQLPSFNLISKDILVKDVKQKTGEINLVLNVKNSGNYVLPVAYFPAWKAKLDGKIINLSQSDRGIIVNLPKGDHVLKVNFKETNIELLSNLLSTAGILILFIGIIYSRLKHD